MGVFLKLFLRSLSLIIVFATVLLLGSACSSIAVFEPDNSSNQDQVQETIADTPVASTPSPTHTTTPLPSPTITSTITPIEDRSPTPTPTLHPMTIQAMRQIEYPGSKIVLESTLTAGSNYNRYYAYYLSDGFKIYGLLTVPYGEPPEGGWPSIVFNHGYIPPSQYRTTERYIAYVDWLARSQYIVFRIDFR